MKTEPKPFWRAAISYARSAPAPASRSRPPPLRPKRSRPDSNDDKRKARYQAIPPMCRPITASTAIRNEGGSRADQEKRTSGAPRFARALPAERPRPRSPHLPAPLRLAAGGLAALGALPLGGVQKPRPVRRPPGRRGHDPQEHLHALRGRLHRHGRSRQRCLDRPGAELGQPDQPRLALRQRRRGARTGHGRTPPEISDEARERPVDTASSGTRPSTRSATS